MNKFALDAKINWYRYVMAVLLGVQAVATAVVANPSLAPSGFADAAKYAGLVNIFLAVVISMVKD